MKKQTKIIAMLVIGFFSSERLQAQSHITFDASQQMTNFKFSSSDGTRDKEYNVIYNGAYALGFRYGLESGLQFNANLGMRKAGATTVYDASSYTWNLQYTDVKLGIAYSHNKSERFHPYLNVSGYFAYLLKASQVINNENFDILKSKNLSNTDYGVFFSPGLTIIINESMSTYFQYNYLLGLANIETSGDGQISKNAGMSLTLGLAFKIK